LPPAGTSLSTNHRLFGQWREGLEIDRVVFDALVALRRR
jgi:hypothetical protein